MQMSESAVIPTTVLVEAVNIAKRAGLNYRGWLSRAGLTPEQLTDPQALVSFRQANSFLTDVVRAFPDRAIGLEAGSRDTFLAMGVLGLAMRSAPSLGTAMAIGMELHQVSGSLMDLTTEQLRPGIVSVVAVERFPAPEILPFLCEEMFASILTSIRAVFVAHPITPVATEFAYAPTRTAREYERFFACPVRFNARANHLDFDEDDLRRPLPTHDPSTHAVALAACRDLASRLQPTHQLVMQVELLLRANLSSPLTMDALAHQLNVTSRTLRRQLAAIGESFSTIHDRVRSDYARHLVRETTLAMTEISSRVGYSDPREFRRAYVRWSGASPSADRQAHTESSMDE